MRSCIGRGPVPSRSSLGRNELSRRCDAGQTAKSSEMSIMGDQDKVMLLCGKGMNDIPQRHVPAAGDLARCADERLVDMHMTQPARLGGSHDGANLACRVASLPQLDENQKSRRSARPAA